MAAHQAGEQTPVQALVAELAAEAASAMQRVHVEVILALQFDADPPRSSGAIASGNSSARLSILQA